MGDMDEEELRAHRINDAIEGLVELIQRVDRLDQRVSNINLSLPPIDALIVEAIVVIDKTLAKLDQRLMMIEEWAAYMAGSTVLQRWATRVAAQGAEAGHPVNRENDQHE